MQEVKKKRKKTALLFKLALLLIAIISAVQLISIHSSISEKEEQLAALEQELAATTAENEQLQKQLDEGVTDEYIEDVAREQLGYVSPFERIFIDVAGE